MGSESGLNTNPVIELNKQLSILASGDDELISQTITNLAKTGDTRLEEFFELYRQGSVYNWPTESGDTRIVVNIETVMDDDFNEFAPLIEPLTGKPFLIDGIQAKPDLLDLEDISPGRKLRSLVNSSKFLIRLFSPDYETRISGVKKCGDPPFLTEATSTLEDIAKDPEEDEKVRWTANESIALIDFGQKAENFEELKSRLDALEKLSLLNSLRALARIDGFEKDIKNLERSESINSKQSATLFKSISKVKKTLDGSQEFGRISG